MWNPSELKSEPERHQDGPYVRVEFLRQSQDDRITLVLDQSARPVPALWTRMTVTSLDEAANSLREREGTLLKFIGRWSTGDPGPVLIEDLPGWAQAHGVDAVVWTALPRKFSGSSEGIATAAQIIEHLDRLPAEKREAAEQYVRNAPRQIDTAYRCAITEALGWTPRVCPSVRR